MTVLRSAGPEGEGGGFDSPSLPPLDSLPSRSDQGGALDPKAEGRSGRLAEKALYCASEVLRIAFSGRHPPCAPIVYARPSGAPAISPINGVKGQANEPAGCFLPLPHAGYGPARPFGRSFWKGNAQFSALLHDLHGLHGLHGFYTLHRFERFA